MGQFPSGGRVQPKASRADLRFHLWRPIAVAEDGDARLERARRRAALRRLLLFARKVARPPEPDRPARRLKLEPRERRPAVAGLRANVREDFGSLVVVGLVALDEAPAVDVNYERPLAALASEQVKAADHLAKALADPARIAALLLRQLSDETDLLAVGIAADEAVDDGRLARLGVRKRRPDRVDFDVFGVIDVDELLVDEGAVGPGLVERVVVLGRLVADLRRRARPSLSRQSLDGAFKLRGEVGKDSPCGIDAGHRRPCSRCRRCGPRR